jgi:CheY-like chemotaxis protein
VLIIDKVVGRLSMANKYLIVDDDDSLRTFLCSLFKEEAEVRSARNGKEALLMTERHHFDIVISDIDMPVMSGIEFSKRAMAANGEFRSHLILMTRELSKEAQSFCRQNKILLLHKPVSVSMIKAVVRLFLVRIGNNAVFTHEARKSFNQLPGGSPEKIRTIIRSVANFLLQQISSSQVFKRKLQKSLLEVLGGTAQKITEEERQILVSLIEMMLSRSPEEGKGGDRARRVFDRQNVSIPALIFDAQSETGQPSIGTINDISFGGIRFSVLKELGLLKNIGSETAEFRVFFTLPERSQPVIVKCRQRWLLSSEEEVQIGAASAFTDFIEPTVLREHLH